MPRTVAPSWATTGSRVKPVSAIRYTATPSGYPSGASSRAENAVTRLHNPRWRRRWFSASRLATLAFSRSSSVRMPRTVAPSWATTGSRVKPVSAIRYTATRSGIRGLIVTTGVGSATARHPRPDGSRQSLSSSVLLPTPTSAPAAHLLGEDGAGQGQDRERVRHHDREQHRHQRVEVVGQLEPEYHRGEGGPHRPSEHRRHADQRPESRAFAGEDGGLEPAQRTSHHEERREHPSRRAGPERDRPDHRLHDEDAAEHRDGLPALKESADGLVAPAERGGKEPAAESHHHAADRGPPHPVDRQLGEGVLGPVHHRGDRKSTRLNPSHR